MIMSIVEALNNLTPYEYHSVVKEILPICDQYLTDEGLKLNDINSEILRYVLRVESHHKTFASGYDEDYNLWLYKSDEVTV
jgi:hypothetical protein